MRRQAGWLTAQAFTGGWATGVDLEYRYSATQNNGQITQFKDWGVGEEVSYSYDSLSRLISAVTTGPEWGQGYAYDGFGNRTSVTVTKGSAPSGNLTYDGLTNHITNTGFSYDANGSLVSMPGMPMSYDIDNRLAWDGASSKSYGYDAANRRVMKSTAAGWGVAGGELYFYGVDGRRMGTYQVSVMSQYWLNIQPTEVNLHFAGRLIKAGADWVVTDRLGSVVKRGSERLRYFPWGEEQVTSTQNRDKFGTYYRDSTGLDYADQRYYASQHGRFLTADPYISSGGLGSPQSWNRYAYVENDPVNWRDPSGLQTMPTPEPIPRPPAPPPPPSSPGDPGAPGTSERQEEYEGPRSREEGDPNAGGGSGGGEPPPVEGKSGVKYYGLYSEGAQYDLVKKGIDEMNSRLKDDADCLEWLQSGTRGGYADASLRDKLAEMTRVAGRIEYRGDNARGIAATALDVPGVDIIVNGQGAFFSGGSSNNQISILLHELAHVTGAPRFIQNDTFDSGAQAANAELLKEKCAKTISP